MGSASLYLHGSEPDANGLNCDVFALIHGEQCTLSVTTGQSNPFTHGHVRGYALTTFDVVSATEAHVEVTQFGSDPPVVLRLDVVGSHVAFSVGGSVVFDGPLRGVVHIVPAAA